jgi:hypothetical protein
MGLWQGIMQLTFSDDGTSHRQRDFANSPDTGKGSPFRHFFCCHTLRTGHRRLVEHLIRYFGDATNRRCQAQARKHIHVIALGCYERLRPSVRGCECDGRERAARGNDGASVRPAIGILGAALTAAVWIGHWHDDGTIAQRRHRPDREQCIRCEYILLVTCSRVNLRRYDSYIMERKA